MLKCIDDEGDISQSSSRLKFLHEAWNAHKTIGRDCWAHFIFSVRAYEESNQSSIRFRTKTIILNLNVSASAHTPFRGLSRIAYTRDACQSIMASFICIG